MSESDISVNISLAAESSESDIEPLAVLANLGTALERCARVSGVRLDLEVAR